MSRPPDTRVQRTRSSASPPRSPLTRHPLGATGHPTAIALAAVFLMLSEAACYRLSAFGGDGKLSRSSRLSGQPAYTLDLGAIDLEMPQSYVFRFHGLPETEMVIGVRVMTGAPSLLLPDDPKPVATEIRLTMTDENDRRVLDTGGRLTAWVWSGTSSRPGESFVYCKGTLTEVPQKDGSALTKRLGVQTDGGWGSYFTPRRDGSYALTVEVKNPGVEVAGTRAELIAESYPWLD